MSNVTTRRRASAAASSRRRLQPLVALFALLIAAMGFVPAAASAESESISRAEFCEAWSAAKAGDDSLTLSTGVKVDADRLIAEGDSCEAQSAAIRTVAPKLSDAPTGPSGTAAAKVLASAVGIAAADPPLANGSEVFENAYLAGFSYWITADWVSTGPLSGYFVYTQRVNGRIVIDFSNTSTQFSFAGTLTDADTYKLTVYSTPEGTKLPSVAGSPLGFKGMFARDGASYKLDLSADVPSATIGEGTQQLSLTDGKLALSLTDETAGTGLKLDASGKLGVGTGVEIDGAIAADFDETGLRSFTGSGGLEVVIPAKGSTPAGSVSGSAQIAYTREPLTRSITFTGGLTVGDAVVANATGTIDDAAISFGGSVEVSSADLAVKGGVDGIVYYGDNLAGRTIASFSGAQVPASKGDVLLKAATAEVTWENLTLRGGVQFGDVGTQTWAKANGAVAISFQTGDQPPTTISGGAGLSWLKGSSPAVSFEGSISSGSTEVVGVKGTIDASKITFQGQATLANPDLKITGAVKGFVVYATLEGEVVKNRSGATVPATKGDFALTSASASIETKGFKLSGNVGLGRVGGERWATGGGAVDLTYNGTSLKGSAQLLWIAGQVPSVTFDGSITSGSNKVTASGTIDGKKLLFSGSLASPTATGNVTGGVYYGSDLSGESIVNKSGATVTPKAGDYYLSGDGSVKLGQFDASATFTLKSVAGVSWLQTTAQIKVAKTTLAFTGEIDSLGNVNLKGSGAVDFDGTTVQFSGAASVVNGKVVIAGSGTVKTGLFSATISGTIEKADAASSAYVLTGSANFKFGTFQVAGASVRLTVGEGLTTAFTIKACFLFICPNATYKLYFRGGSPYRAELNAPIAWAVQFLGIGAVVLGPNVPISTKITGLI